MKEIEKKLEEQWFNRAGELKLARCYGSCNRIIRIPDQMELMTGDGVPMCHDCFENVVANVDPATKEGR